MGAPEFELLAALRPYLDGDSEQVPLGVDDDAAVVTIGDVPVSVAVDTLVEDVHFTRELSSMPDVGWKALAVNVSDLAAIGSEAVACVVSLQRPRALPDEDADGLYRGLREAADRWEVRVVGGDVVTSPTFAVSITVVGRLAAGAPLRRDGARPGDLVLVVGDLGQAAAALALHRAGADDVLADHPELLAAHRRPEVLPEGGVALAAGGATACIDVSDGLGRDLGHVAEQSGVGIRLEASRLPRAAGVLAAAERLGADALDLVVGGGDDYALAACVPPESHARVEEALRAVGRRGVVVGHVHRGSGVTLVRSGAAEQPVDGLGWEH